MIKGCPTMTITSTSCPVGLQSNIIEWLVPGKKLLSELNENCHPAAGEVEKMEEPVCNKPPGVVEKMEESVCNKPPGQTGVVEKMEESVCNKPPGQTGMMGSNRYIVANMPQAGLFLALRSVLSAEGEGEVTYMNEDRSHLKAYAVDGCHLVDVEVQVLQVDNVVSKAVFSHPSRTDTVRLSRVFQRVVDSLRLKGFCIHSPQDELVQGPFVVDSLDDFLDDFENDFAETSGDDDHDWAAELAPLIGQAQSTNLERRLEAIVLLAETAQASPACRVGLAGILTDKPEILDLLLSVEAPLTIQFAAAKMLAYIGLCVDLPAVASQACSSTLGARLLKGASTLVRAALLQAIHNFRVN